MAHQSQRVKITPYRISLNLPTYEGIYMPILTGVTDGIHFRKWWKQRKQKVLNTSLLPTIRSLLPSQTVWTRNGSLNKGSKSVN